MVPHPAIEAAAEANAVASRSSLNLRLAGGAAEANAPVASRSSLNLRVAGVAAGSPEPRSGSAVPPVSAGLTS